MIVFFEPGRVQTISAGFRISDETFNYLVDLFPSDQKSFRAPDEQNASAMQRFTHSVDSLNCKIDIVKRTFLSIRCIFDRKSCDAGFGTQARVFRDPVWIIGITVFEIGVHRDIGRFDQFLDVREHVVALDRAIG